MEVMNALQPLAAGMDLPGIKRTYGGTLVLHGAIDVQKALPGTVDDVWREVRTRLAALGAGGGYILAPSNIIQADVPPVNILALSAACRALGKYPLEVTEG